MSEISKEQRIKNLTFALKCESEVLASYEGEINKFSKDPEALQHGFRLEDNSIPTAQWFIDMYSDRAKNTRMDIDEIKSELEEIK